MPKKRKFFIISICIAFVSAGIIMASVLSSLLISPTSSPAGAVNSPNMEIHFISMNKSQVESSAKALAVDYQAIGAGGYIWKEGEYFHIFSSGFENKNDATLVQNNLASQNLPSEIVSIKFDGFKISGTFSSEEKKVLQKVVNSFENTYKNLYDIAISLDTAVYNDISARLAVNSVHSNLSNIIRDFETMFSSTENAQLKALAASLKKANNCTQNLCSGTLINRNQTYASLIKYRYIELLEIYQGLCQNLNQK